MTYTKNIVSVVLLIPAMSPVTLLLLLTAVAARPDTSDTDSMAESDSSSTRGECGGSLHDKNKCVVMTGTYS